MEYNYQDFEIVLAGCIHSFLSPSHEMNKVYYTYPFNEKELTVSKKLTTQKSFMKPVEEDDEEKASNDKVISTLPLRRGRVCTIGGEEG